MKKQFYTLLITAFAIPRARTIPPPSQQPPIYQLFHLKLPHQEESAGGWQPLFDGMTLNGWRGYNRTDLPKSGWSVQNGELVIAATPKQKPGRLGGDIVAAEEYGYFEHSFDFMLSDSANDGILLVLEEKDSAIWHNTEYQLIDNETGRK